MPVEVKQEAFIAPSMGAPEAEAHLAELLQRRVGADAIARARLPAWGTREEGCGRQALSARTTVVSGESWRAPSMAGKRATRARKRASGRRGGERLVC